ncbi:MAG: carboxypeptidase-like regulatory domain-containing protein, partial [bacterium]
MKSENGTLVIDAPLSCDLTVCVDSPDYLNEYGNWGIFTIDSEDDSRSFELQLRKGATLRGTVTAAVGGEPVAGARVSAIISSSPDAHGLDLERSVVTDEHGKFVLRGMDPELGISVSHGSYLAFDGSDIANHAKRLPSFDMSARIALRKGEQTLGTTASAVVLKHESLTEVRGTVVGPDGKPVEHFEVVLGPTDDPKVWQCHKASIADSNGCFKIDAPFQGRNWIVIRAAGLVPWEGSINAGSDAGAATIRLAKGSAIQGRIVARGSKNQMQGTVVLTPRLWVKNGKGPGASAGEEFLSQEAVVGVTGEFQIGHVMSGEYVLAFAGPMASPTEFLLSVGSADIDLGTIEVAGLGGIQGKAVCSQVVNAGGALAYADGEVRGASDPVGDVIRSFTTDENGDFSVEGVPSGVVAVNILPKESGNAGDFLRFARVCDAKKTVVDFNNPQQSAELCLNIMVGNGSAADYSSALGYSTSLSTNSAPGPSENHDVPVV